MLSISNEQSMHINAAIPCISDIYANVIIGFAFRNVIVTSEESSHADLNRNRKKLTKKVSVSSRSDYDGRI